MLAFDTLSAAHELESAGMERKQAKAVASLGVAGRDDLATEADLGQLRTAIAADLEKFQAAAKADLEHLKNQPVGAGGPHDAASRGRGRRHRRSRQAHSPARSAPFGRLEGGVPR